MNGSSSILKETPTGPMGLVSPPHRIGRMPQLTLSV